MSTTTAKKPARHSVRHTRRTAMATPARPPKPSKRLIAEMWAKASGIVNTGETNLSTREGLGD